MGETTDSQQDKNQAQSIAEQLVRILISQVQDKRKNLNINKDKNYDKRKN